MAFGKTLDAILTAAESDIAGVVQALADAAAALSRIVAQGALAGDLGAEQNTVNAAGDGQKVLDLLADDLFLSALRGTAAAFVATEERDDLVRLRPDGTVAVVIDPLDGSSNINVNISVGTIFGLYAVSAPEEPLRPGSAQRAAGFFVYGPQTAFVLALQDGVRIFILDREAGAFRLTADRVAIPDGVGEYAINASNYRHWDDGVRAFIDDCLEGESGPRAQDFNMRWIASLVAEAYRILVRGGVFLYPADKRRSYGHGRLRLVYEANPIAFVMEKAGGAASDGKRRILDIVPTSLHERIPLVFGSAEKVACIARYADIREEPPERSPLFSRRGLLRV